MIAEIVSFSVFKLLLFMGWFYLCLYISARIQFSKSIPKPHRPMVSLAALISGPILVPLIGLINAFKIAARTGQSVKEVIEEKLDHFVERIKNRSLGQSKRNGKVKLLDSSGRALAEVYGNQKNRHDIEVLELTEEIIQNALDSRASDILIDPKDSDNYVYRIRVDGVLSTVKEIPTKMAHAVLNSIKAVSNMDISERRRPQDGAFSAHYDDTVTSFRVATAGVLQGEKISIRVLNTDASRYTLKEIGFSSKQIQTIKSIQDKPSGMILLSGPTGSGKTTTLYAMLNELDRYTRNVITVEDPVEAYLPESSQIEINPKADITFAKTLRSILRQDPDVIVVGEIRDEETAEIALRAAQTGHLVIATIHSDSNAMALVRLLDLGISPMLITSAMKLMISQRLIRILCTDCKIPAQLTQTKIREYAKKKINCTSFKQAGSCESCNYTGYYGRVAIGDLLIMTDALRTDIMKGPEFIKTLRNEGTKKGRSNLYKQGLKRVVLGQTTIDELHRVVG